MTTQLMDGVVYSVMQTRLLDRLFRQSEMYHRKELEALIIENNQLQSSRAPGFLYQGKPYRNSKAVTPPLVDLHPDLYSRMENYLNFLSKMDEDQYFIQRFLSLLFSYAQTPQQLTAILGDNLVTLLDPPAEVLDSNQIVTTPRPLMDDPNHFRIVNQPTINLMNERMVMNSFLPPVSGDK